MQKNDSQKSKSANRCEPQGCITDKAQQYYAALAHSNHFLLWQPYFAAALVAQQKHTLKPFSAEWQHCFA